MALDESQVELALECLGLPVRTDITFELGGDGVKLRNAEIAKYALESVSASQEASVIAILAQYDTVRFDTDDIHSRDLSSSPAKMRARLCGMLANTIGFAPERTGGPSFRIGRG